MGGATITHNGTEDEILAFMKQQVKAAIGNNLYPDSALAIIDPEKKQAKLFKVEVDEEGNVTFTESPEGTIFHVGAAARFSEPPEPGQLVGTLHVGPPL